VAGPVVRRTFSTLTRKRSTAAKVKPPLDDDFFAAPAARTASVPTTAPAPGGMRECPFCAEQIMPLAKKCKHCGETLDVALRAAEEARRSVEALASQQHGAPAYAAPVNVHVNNVVTTTTIVGGKAKQGFSLLAGLLSLFIPGLGQLYRGRFFAAVFWFVLTAAGYACFFIPGVVLHILCVLSALFG
jgi:TM2 domain-containing membrane protein YozV